MSLRSLALVGAAGLISSVSAHGYVSGIVAGGKYYPGWSYSDSFESPLPDLIAWSTTVSDNGFVAPDEYTNPDIICHKGAKPGALAAKVAAGDTVKLEWTPWPDSHHGPVIDYLAPCNGDCSSVDKTTLEFFKISQGGLINDATPPGTWASDKLIAANNSWTVTIPSDIASGNYVLRHEIIALHSAESQDGAQNYPQCINIQVTGGGSAKPSGEVGTKFYTPTEKGILINIYEAISNYVIPGPPLYSGGSSSGGASSAPASPASSTAPVSSTGPASSAPASSAPVQSGGASYSAPAGSSAGAVSSSAPSAAPSGYSAPAGSSAGAVPSSAAASSSKCTSTITISRSASGSSYPASSAGAISSSIVPAGSSSGTGAFSLPIPSATSVPYPSGSASGGFSIPIASGTSVPYPSGSASSGFSVPVPSGTSAPYPSASGSTSPSSVSPPIPSSSAPAGYPSPPGSSPDMESLMAKIIRYIKASFRKAEHAKDFKKF